MHKVNSPVEMQDLMFKTGTDGVSHAWMRKNQIELPETEDGPSGYEADEVYITTEEMTEEDLYDDFDFIFNTMADYPDGSNADHLFPLNYKKVKREEISAACESSIYNGVDVTLSGGTEHFSLTEKDQLNLFGKQAQLAAGVTQLEYHQDGRACKYYSAEDMQAIIGAAMQHVSFQTTYCNSLFMWLESCTKASEMAEIVYGCEVPVEHQSAVLKVYMNA